MFSFLSGLFFSELWVKSKGTDTIEEKGSVGTLNAYTISLEMLLGFERWLACSEHSPATREKYLREARWFAAWLNTLPLEKNQLIAWRDTLVGKGYTVATINGKMAAIHALLYYLGRKTAGCGLSRCSEGSFGSRAGSSPAGSISACCPQPGQRPAPAAAHHGGARFHRNPHLGALLHHTGSIDRGQTTVRCKGKLRTILLPRKLCRRLRRYAVERGITAGPIFRTKGGKPVDRSNVWKELKALARRPVSRAGGVFPHNFRHLFARRFYALEKDLGKLADVLGHSSISTTRIYLMESGRAHERLLNQMKMLL